MIDIPVRITLSDKSTSGVVSVCRWTDSQRKWRGIKTLLIVWGLALLTLFIPILHFILVPILLLAGPIAASVSYAQRSLVLGGEGLCPNCNAKFPIAKAREAWPLDDICTKCNRHVKIEPLNSN